MDADALPHRAHPIRAPAIAATDDGGGRWNGLPSSGGAKRVVAPSPPPAVRRSDRRAGGWGRDRRKGQRLRPEKPDFRVPDNTSETQNPTLPMP